MWSYVQYIVWLPSLGASDRARRRPAQEVRPDEHVDHSTASGRLESPKTRGLRGSQRQARHFEKFSTYPMDEGVEVRMAIQSVWAHEASQKLVRPQARCGPQLPSETINQQRTQRTRSLDFVRCVSDGRRNGTTKVVPQSHGATERSQTRGFSVTRRLTGEKWLPATARLRDISWASCLRDGQAPRHYKRSEN